MKNWIALFFLLKINSSLFCMAPYIDTKKLSTGEKKHLRILRIALDACRKNASHLDHFLPNKAPYTPLDLAQTIPDFSPIAYELKKIKPLNKKRKMPASSTIEGIDIKSVDLFDSHRLRALHFYMDACRQNPTRLNKTMPYTIPDLPLSISAASDKFLNITKELLRIGARPNIFNHPIGGHTPLFKAIQHDARNTIRFLIRHGALLFFVRKTRNKQRRIKYGNIIDGKKLWSKDPKTFAFAEQEFALRMLLLCRQKEGGIMHYVPKDVLKMIAEKIND